MKSGVHLFKCTPLYTNIPRKRPTLPPSLPGSTIGAIRLNFSVRNGKRCDPYAITSEENLKNITQNISN